MNDTAIDHALMRESVLELYADYYDCLDDVKLADWPEFFVDDCFYRLVSRENFEQGLRLSTILCESKGALEDRVTGLTKTQVYAPRYYRRFAGPIRVTPEDDGRVSATHNLLIAQTLVDKQTEIVMAGRCYDFIEQHDKRWLIKERVVVFDSEMVPNSFIYPA